MLKKKVVVKVDTSMEDVLKEVAKIAERHPNIGNMRKGLIDVLSDISEFGELAVNYTRANRGREITPNELITSIMMSILADAEQCSERSKDMIAQLKKLKQMIQKGGGGGKLKVDMGDFEINTESEEK